MNLNALKDKAYKLACERGFHDKELSNDHCLMLVITELSEAIEADRKGKYITSEDVKIYLSLQKERFCADVYDNCIKGSVDEELSDACIRLLDLAGLRNIDLGDGDEGWNDIVSLIRPDVKNAYSFPELMFALCEITNSYDDIDDIICSMLVLIRVICYAYNIDIEWHIEQKMRYNSLREKMHGKKY